MNALFDEHCASVVTLAARILTLPVGGRTCWASRQASASGPFQFNQINYMNFCMGFVE